MTPRRFQMNSRPITRSARPRGFSLLEALIAVVVLSTGLLALAALQSAMIRSSVDARIRSSASAAAVAVLEDLRAGGYQAIPTGANTVNVATENYIVPDPAVVGGFTISYNSEVWVDNAGTFVNTPLPPGAPPPLAEFKKIDITVGWTDPYGSGQRSLVFTDLVGPLGASLTSPDLSQLGSTLNNQRPIVITTSPEGPGVIPIAVGDGEDTAATNPKPVIVSQGNRDSIIETRFDVLNFSNASDVGEDLVRIQKRVETSVVACRCSLGASSGTTDTIAGTAFRPTYWDGTRYIPPVRAASGGGAPSNSAATQSELCLDCCRDHHDPAGVSGAKFDPFRAQASVPHDHFLTVDASNPLNSTPVSGGGDYFEACRLIRVDGLWRVAADLDSRFFGLLKTSQDAEPADNPVPDQDAADDYEQFVIESLKDEFVSTTPTVNRSTDLAPRYAAVGLDNPTSIDIDRPSAGGNIDLRFLHARGFYVDFIEPDAQAVIDKARDDCTNAAVETCVLPFVPFTTINVTELAKWSPSVPQAVQVTNASSVIFGDPRNPVRGQVSALPQGPATGEAVTNNGRSNTGLAATNQVADPQDALEAQADRQRFDIDSGGVDPQGERFNVIVVGLPQTSDDNTSNDPGIAWQIGNTGINCTGTFSNNNDDNPNPYACTTTSLLNTSVDVIAGAYNRVVTGTATVTCSTSNGSVTESRNDVPFCENYEVESGSAGLLGLVTGSFGAPSNDGLLSESTVISFPLILPNDTVNLTFRLQNSTRATVATCSLNGGRNRIQSITYNNPCQ